MTEREKELIVVIEKDLAALDIRLVRVEIWQEKTSCEEHHSDIRTLKDEVNDMKTKWAILIATVVIVTSFLGTALARWLVP